MSLRFEESVPIPDETVRVARAAFPKGNRYMAMRDVLGPIYEDASFAPLFSRTGRPAESPWRMALVTVMQFAEGLSDRQAAEAVRARIDWKYALALELTDPGFDFSVLSEFRARLVQGSAEEILLDTLLVQCTAHGLLKARGRQRTDSTHVLMAVRALNRLERVSETLRQALNALAEVVPDWLRAQAPVEWYERYGRRVEEYRLPRGKVERQRYVETVGADGLHLLEAVYAADAPPVARTLPAVQLLRRVWMAEFQVIDGQVQQRAQDNMPPVSERVESPYDADARFGIKRNTEWSGYKVHVSETCEDDLPDLLTHVETTVATEPDVNHLEQIHNALAAKDLPPAEHLVDAGYSRAPSLVSSLRDHAITVIGPVYEDRSWQAHAGEGYDLEHFTIDWEQQVVTCPRGRRSIRWCVTHTARQRTMGSDNDSCNLGPFARRMG
jgi:transposase